MVEELPDSLRRLYSFRNEESNYILVEGGHRLHFVDEGEGETILMVHGNPTWSFFYRNLVLGLRDQFRCIAVDHIGCGLSDKPQDYAYLLENHVENLSRLVEELRLEKFHLIVHDWGGAIGMAVAERFKERVKRIVILNTAAFLSKRIPWRINICRMPVVGDVIVRGLNGFARGATFMAAKREMSLEVKKGYLFPYDNWSNRIAILRFVQDIPLNERHPSFDVLNGIDAGLKDLDEKSMMICWGGRDFCFNDHFFEEWKQRFPEAEAHYFPDAGHYILEDEEEAVLARVQKFLSVKKPL